MKQSIRPVHVVLIALAMLLAVSAPAWAAGPTAADRAAFQNFKLTDSFIEKWEAYSEDAIRQPCKLSMMVALADSGQKPKTLDETVAALNAKPEVRAVLERHDLTAREALLGAATLMSAAMQNLREKHPEMAQDVESSGPGISAANMAFYRQHAAQIQKHQRTIAREQLKRNGGKLPACLTGK